MFDPSQGGQACGEPESQRTETATTTSRLIPFARRILGEILFDPSQGGQACGELNYNIVRPCGELVVRLQRLLLDSFHSLEEYCSSTRSKNIRYYYIPYFTFLNLYFAKYFSALFMWMRAYFDRSESNKDLFLLDWK